MNIPRIDHRTVRAIAGKTSLVRADVDAIRTAADRLQVLEDALFLVLHESIPSGRNGPFMLSRETMSKIAAVYSPGMEVLRRIAVKCSQNKAITEQDVDEAMDAMRRVQSGEQPSG